MPCFPIIFEYLHTYYPIREQVAVAAKWIVCATKRIASEIKALRERTRNGLDPACKEERVGDRRPKTQGTSAAGDLAPG